jgi:putative membrane protein insertion efficiency factor
MSPVARALRWFVRGYQHLRAGRPSPCRYQPTCSSYALEALEVHGAARGSWLAIRRLSRCHPWGGHGWDPVPRPADHDHHDHHADPERTAA